MNINQAVLDTFAQIKIDREVCAMTLAIDTAAQAIFCLESFPKGTPYQTIIGQLPQNEIRFLVIDVGYETDETPPRTENKLVLIKWKPETAPLRQKLAFPVAGSTVKETLTGLQFELLVETASDLDFAEVRKALLKR